MPWYNCSIFFISFGRIRVNAFSFSNSESTYLYFVNVFAMMVDFVDMHSKESELSV